MSEAQRIVALSRRARARGEQLCLATVVHVEGSAYRKPGARMLVTSGGERAGTISGGCLESEVSRKAWWLTAHGARVQRYSSFADEDGGMPYGLGCGGTVSLLLEQGLSVEAALAALERALEMREPSVIVMALGAQTTPADGQGFAAAQDRNPYGRAGVLAIVSERDGERRVEDALAPGMAADGLQVVFRRSSLQAGGVEPGFTRNGAEACEEVDFAWLSAVQTAFRERQSLYLDHDSLPCSAYASSLAYFVEYLRPAPALTIFGAGDDAQPIAELAQILGWRVSVVDGRSHLARRERFPQAAEVRVLDYADPALRVACGMAAASGAHEASLQEQGPWQPGSSTVLSQGAATLVSDEIAVILTHSYEQDRALLTALLPRRLRYLGILGPRHRTERLLAEVTPGLDISVEEGFARLHSPIGLDLGSGDPAAVALSIVAEIQAVLQGRDVAIARPGGRTANQIAAD